MVITLPVICLLLSLLCFLLVVAKVSPKLYLTALGLALLAVSFLLR